MHFAPGVGPAIDMSDCWSARADSLLLGGGVTALLADLIMYAYQPEKSLSSQLLSSQYFSLAHGPEPSSTWIAPRLAIPQMAYVGASVISSRSERIAVDDFSFSIGHCSASSGVTAMSLYLFLWRLLRFIFVISREDSEHILHSGLLAQMLIAVFGFLLSALHFEVVLSYRSLRGSVTLP